jgi:ADP-L-glycero-D-manno-heptose 6-epimerase
MIVVTGGAGMIGSAIVRALNARGETGILVVDHLKNGRKFANLAPLRIADYLEADDFLELLRQDRAPAGIRAILHQGACAVTTEWDGQYMMRNNYQYSKELLVFCQARRVPFIYASSAAVYGASRDFRPLPENEQPLNVYGYSKLLLDQWVRRLEPTRQAQVVGLRYFNVYGPGEDHKGSMASVAWHMRQRLLAGQPVELFGAGEGCEPGEHRRDFIFVEDVAEVNLWLLDHPEVSGIFNLGTGRAQSFNELAQAACGAIGHGELRYIAFPEALKGRYQSFTQADLSGLRAAGYQADFADVREGVRRYYATLAHA